MSSISNPDILAVTDLANESWRLTPDRLGAKLTAHLAEESPERFLRPRHVRYLGAVIARTLAAGNRNLGLSQPPQTGKSKLIALWTPVWFLHVTEGRGRVGFGTYSDAYAREWGRAVRNTISEHGKLLGVKLSSDSFAANSWRTTVGGGMWTAGSHGGMTGRSFDLLLIDDPFKDLREAHSPAIRAEVWNWYTTVARPRVQPGGTKITDHTRWNEDDLLGLFAKLDEIDGAPAEHWDLIRLPALAEAGDPLGREPGEALWPERYDAAYYAVTKSTVGLYVFSAVYQQAPSPLTGGMFPREAWRKTDVAPAGVGRFVRRWDQAFSDTGDWFATALVALADDGRVVIAHVDRIRSEDADLVDRWMQRIAEDDRGIYGVGKVVNIVEQEPSAGGKRTAKYYATHVLAGHNVRTEPSSGRGNKTLRATPLSSQVKAGNVWLVRQRGADIPQVDPIWFGDFVEEAALFPEGGHDDMIDAATLAYLDLTSALPQRRRASVRSAAALSLP